MKRLFNTKKLLAVLLILSLFLPSALAGLSDEPFHCVESVTDTEKNAAKYKKFDKASEPSIIIPGLGEDFVPQGLAYYAPGNLMFFTGYSSWGPYSSTLFAVDMETNEIVKELLLAKTDGDAYTGHAGGVCVTDKNIFISDEGFLHRIPLSDFHAAGVMDVVGFAESIPVPCKASYCQVSGNILWVGEFFSDDKPEYRTDTSHHITVGRNRHYAWLLGYKLVNDTENELNPACMTDKGAIPDYIFSTTDRIQGVTFCENKLYLSQSYGRTNDSTIYRYDNVLIRKPDEQVKVLGATRPLWFLGGRDGKDSLTAPPMTEGLCTIGDSVYVSFESGATTYRDPADPSETKAKNPVDRVFKINPSKF